MTDSEKIDAEAIADQASVLAKHLQASGIAFLPTPNPAEVENWSQRMGVERDQAPSAPAQVAAPTPVTPPASPTSPAVPKPTPSLPPAPTKVLADIKENYPGPVLAQADRDSELAVLQQQVAECMRCSILSDCRTKTVFGEGSSMPRVAFFGEGPGADEDKTGRPFVGKAGQLLTKMIEACKMKREECYILNTVKCRPPGNRNPEPDEIANCRPFFERQLQVLRPEYIVCLGAVASQSLLDTKSPVGKLRGKLHRYFDSKVLVTYHPAYLLRNPAAKKAAWQDLQIMLRDAGLI